MFKIFFESSDSFPPSFINNMFFFLILFDLSIYNFLHNMSACENRTPENSFTIPEWLFNGMYETSFIELPDFHVN